jgi:predicted ArsR family transcriptional regulator
MPDLDDRLNRISALAEPVRRALYRFVVSQREPVTREQAAAAVGVPHHVAKFNLDRLVEQGLLHADYRRPPGRGGPGAGRPAKVYCRAGVDVEVSVPERRYELAARLLAHAVAEAEREDAAVADTLESVATDAGRERGTGAEVARTKRHATANVVADVLEAEGYEPQRDRHDITLRNCPFHALAQEETELVCGMNRTYIEGVLDGLGADGYEAVLDPAEGRCCVRVRRR